MSHDEIAAQSNDSTARCHFFVGQWLDVKDTVCVGVCVCMCASVCCVCVVCVNVSVYATHLPMHPGRRWRAVFHSPL